MNLWMTLICATLAAAVLFAAGYVIGYLSGQNKMIDETIKKLKENESVDDDIDGTE